jgi:hypothetical protein
MSAPEAVELSRKMRNREISMSETEMGCGSGAEASTGSGSGPGDGAGLDILRTSRNVVVSLDLFLIHSCRTQKVSSQ